MKARPSLLWRKIGREIKAMTAKTEDDRDV
jgi:hypothetical protein